MEMNDGKDKGRVCVTGATGFVASWLIKRLLQHNYCVHATVRSPGNKDMNFLTSLPRASTKLKIFNADMDEPDSYKPAIEECIAVFHVAHPIDFHSKTPEETITKRAIHGTIGILKASLESKTVKRVVMTGTAGSIVFPNNNNTSDANNYNNEVLLDENSWTDVDVVRATTSDDFATYTISKTLTEKAAVEFAEQHGLDLVIVSPTLVTGPFLLPYVPITVLMSLAPLFGTRGGYPIPENLQMVHVDDLARAHIFVLEHTSAKGRYLCNGAEINALELSDYLATKYPDLYKAKDVDPLKENKGEKYASCTSKKLLDAGFKFQCGIAEICDDGIQCCKLKGLL